MSELRRVETVDKPIDARIRPPGSKSITIRALVAGALASGRSHLYGALGADDTTTTVEILRGFGVEVHDNGEPWTVVGSDGHLQAPEGPINVGQSGLSARIALVLAAHADGVTQLEAEGRLLTRPIAGLVRSLESQGASITTTDGFLPATVEGVGGLWGGEIGVDSSQTSQFATALMLVAPLMTEGASLRLEDLDSSHGYAELTARVMDSFGATVAPTITGFEIQKGEYTACDYVVEPDASAAAYPLVAAAITGGQVVIEGLAIDSPQPDIGVAAALSSMGCQVENVDGGMSLVAPRGPMSGLNIDMSNAPDGAVALAIACMFASGRSRISGLQSLQHKESDRMAALQTEMSRLGCRVTVDDDALVIEPAALHGGIVDSHDDHRIAMAMGVAGIRVPGVSVVNAGVVSKTWPGYWAAMEQLTRAG